METPQQIAAWQEQLDKAGKHATGNLDVARRLLKHAQKTREEFITYQAKLGDILPPLKNGRANDSMLLRAKALVDRVEKMETLLIEEFEAWEAFWNFKISNRTPGEKVDIFHDEIVPADIIQKSIDTKRARQDYARALVKAKEEQQTQVEG